MRILIIEDNPDITANLYGFLEPLGYTIDSARNGLAGLALAAHGEYDAMVLDLTLPGLGGLDVCRCLRNEFHRTTPVLILTARDTVQDKVVGFDSGADDYLVKPFSMVELEIRLKALVRRANYSDGDLVLHFGDLQFNPATFEAVRDGVSLQFTPIGYKILAALLRAAPRVVRRDVLEHEVWGDERPDSDALRTHLHAVRTILDKPFDSPMLKTLPGIGYKLVAPDA